MNADPEHDLASLALDDLALDALSSAETKVARSTGGRDAHAIVQALGAVTYGLLLVAREIQHWRESWQTPPSSQRSRRS